MFRYSISVLLVVLAFAPSAMAAEGVEIHHNISLQQYIEMDIGSVDNVQPGAGGTLRDINGEALGSIKVLYVENRLSVARVMFREDVQKADLRTIELGDTILRNNRFRYITNMPESYVFLTGSEIADARRGMKGEFTRMGTEGSELVGYFRVFAVVKGVEGEDDQALALAFQLAYGMDYRDIEKAEFQDYFTQILGTSGFVNLEWGNLIMIIVGLVFIYLAVVKDYEPLLLVPIGFGILIGNIPLPVQIFNAISIYMIDPITHEYVFNTTTNSVFGIIYSLVTSGVLPPLIFLGIGAMTDFTALLSNPKTVFLGAAAQFGVFSTFLGALYLGFSPAEAASIGIIGGADGPTAIFLTGKLAPTLIGPIAIAAYSYMGLIPIIQPPIMKLLTTKKEKLIRMKPGRKVTKTERIIFPIIGFLVTTMIAPGAIPLLGMLFFGNLLKESGVTGRLSKTASNALIDIATMLLGVGVGASTTAQVFLNPSSIMIFVLGCVAFATATAIGVLFAKIMNIFLKQGNKINPLIGSAGVSAVPDAARVSELIGRQYDPNNHLLMHAMGPNVAGVIGSAIAAGVLLGIF